MNGTNNLPRTRGDKPDGLTQYELQTPIYPAHAGINRAKL